MQCRRGDVRRSLAGHLHNVLTQVGFECSDAIVGKCVIQFDFFTDQTLDLDDLFDRALFCQREHNRTRMFGIACPVNDTPRFAHALFDLGQVLVEMRERVQFQIVTGLAQGLPICFAECRNSLRAFVERSACILLRRRDNLRRRALTVRTKVNVRGHWNHLIA